MQELGRLEAHNLRADGLHHRRPRQQLLDTLGAGIEEIAFALVSLADEQLDKQRADKLQQELLRPVQMAYGRTKRTHAEFARRHGLPEQPAARRPRAQGVAEVKVTECIAPSYAELRPFKLERTETFPVYSDLVEKLVSANTYPDDTLAHVMAVCSAYAYAEVATVATVMARMGLEENHCVMIDEYVDVMFITSTSFLVQSKDGRVVILCYRGTPPTSLITWLTDANIDPTHVDIRSPSDSRDCYVHGGFYRNVRSTRYEVLNALKRAIDGHSVRPNGGKLANKLKALYITGHSLGAASASMLALMLVVEPAYQRPIVSRLRAVYTFGGPMLASRELAGDCDQHDFLRERVIRYVYDNDIVPQLPPAASGSFAHFGTGYQYKPKGDTGSWEQNNAPRKQLRDPLEIAFTPLTFLAGDLKLTRRIHFRASIRDHLPQYYISALTPPGIRSEFGD